jgi:hypothetical protein
MSARHGSGRRRRTQVASFASCTSPALYTGLAAGSHTFDVRATDAAGNVDPSPATYVWNVE